MFGLQNTFAVSSVVCRSRTENKTIPEPGGAISEILAIIKDETTSIFKFH